MAELYDPRDAFEREYLKGNKPDTLSFIFMRDDSGDYVNIFTQQYYWHFLNGYRSGKAALVAEKGL